MKHSRPDYDRIQDPAGLIPEDEPLFFLRAQYQVAAATVRFWADLAEEAGAGPEMVANARDQADAMEAWATKKVPVEAGPGRRPGRGSPAMKAAVDLQPFQIDITTANNLIAEWGRIAAAIARQCKWRPKGQCLLDCLGLAVCNLDGLTLVDGSSTGFQPVDLSEQPADLSGQPVNPPEPEP